MQQERPQTGTLLLFFLFRAGRMKQLLQRDTQGVCNGKQFFICDLPLLSFNCR